MSRNRLKAPNRLQTNKVGWIVAGSVVLLAGMLLFLCLNLSNRNLAEFNKEQEKQLKTLEKANEKLMGIKSNMTDKPFLEKQVARFHPEMVLMAQEQTWVVEDFRGDGELVARGKNYSSRARGD